MLVCITIICMHACHPPYKYADTNFIMICLFCNKFLTIKVLALINIVLLIQATLNV